MRLKTSAEKFRQNAAPSGPIPENPPTEICLTVDTEFSIGGAFSDPQRYRPLSEESVVEGMIGRREHGLGFLLRSLAGYGAHATFFIETLQCCYFGERRMGRIVDRIAEQGHDVQLHLHPGWMQFRGPEWRHRRPVNDCCGRCAAGELEEMIALSFDLFRRWGVAAPIALRAGGFCCSRTVQQAMSNCGLRLGSNIALALYQPADKELHVANAGRRIAGVLELPVLTYRSPRPPAGSELRPLAITATSWSETKALLWQAREAGISPVIVLTHPFEFIKKETFRYDKLRPNRVNQARLERLLDYVGGHRADFVMTTFASSGAGWLEQGLQPDRLFYIPPHLALARAGQQWLNNRVWYY